MGAARPDAGPAVAAGPSPRARLAETAAAQGLGELLGPVEIAIADVATPAALAGAEPAA